jgi:hypothetical protein
LADQQKRDGEKRQYAKENGITLIVIPYTELPELIERLAHSEDRSKPPDIIRWVCKPEP